MLSGLGLALGLVASPAVYAAKAPRPVLTDTRVRQVLFDPNQVYEVAGTYGYQTAIEFSQGESIKVVSLGDSIAWQAVPYRNRLFLKPVEPNASTNLTVITDKRTYFFRLRGAAASQPMTFVVRFVYPGSGGRDAQGRHGDGDAPGGRAGGQSVDIGRLNFDYGQSGDRAAIPLIRAFDDGQFTYLLFDKDGDVPAVYLVAADGTESVVNTRREGEYLVVERVGARFTLRSGKAYLCLQNRRLAGRGAAPTEGGGNG
ncbi:TrbG/VirB9 family P-type conjugative transfer protein [Cupriavidus respiraculi]|nr:TrbG/VirB9 family P-type conjugative transfer protein [Cupriavidus respiraculi]